MKIIVRTIPAQGLELKESIEPVTIGLSESEIGNLHPLEVTAHVARAGDAVIANANVKTRYTMECARCLETTEVKYNEKFDFDYPIEKGIESIDLGEDVRQEFILALPVKILCKEDCKGICPGCGVNLNKEKCKCGS